MKNAPEVTPTKVWQEPGERFYRVAIKCPHCQIPHLHGWDGEGNPGHRHRVSHCYTRFTDDGQAIKPPPNDGYYILAPAKQETRA